MGAFAPERQVEPQNGERRLGKSIRHFYQQLCVAVTSGAMRKHNGLSRRPCRYMEPAMNSRVAVEVSKRSSHGTVNRLVREKRVYSPAETPSIVRQSPFSLFSFLRPQLALSRSYEGRLCLP